jgi:L-seryl-tRNA(Ser) seleniumtransferase
MWVKRDHKAEWAQWEQWLNHIAESVKRVPGVTTKMAQGPEGLSNRSPELTIQWEGRITGQDLSKVLFETEPRITFARAGNSSISIVPYQMSPGDEKVVAERLYAALMNPPKVTPPTPPPAGAMVSVAGQWDVRLDFVYGLANHSLILEQDGASIVGTHHGEFATGDLSGAVASNQVTFTSSLPTDGTRVSFQFTGTLSDGKLSGTVTLGEYGEARWMAERHPYRGRRG